MEEKLSAVAVLRNSPGIDRTVVHDVEGMLSNVMKQCAAREHKLQQSLQLVSATFLIMSYCCRCCFLQLSVKFCVDSYKSSVQYFNIRRLVIILKLCHPTKNACIAGGGWKIEAN